MILIAHDPLSVYCEPILIVWTMICECDHSIPMWVLPSYAALIPACPIKRSAMDMELEAKQLSILIISWTPWHILSTVAVEVLYIISLHVASRQFLASHDGLSDWYWSLSFTLVHIIMTDIIWPLFMSVNVILKSINFMRSRLILNESALINPVDVLYNIAMHVATVFSIPWWTDGAQVLP